MEKEYLLWDISEKEKLIAGAKIRIENEQRKIKKYSQQIRHLIKRYKG